MFTLFSSNQHYFLTFCSTSHMLAPKDKYSNRPFAQAERAWKFGEEVQKLLAIALNEAVDY